MPLGPDALPLREVVALDVLFPPIGAAIWWVMSRSLGAVIQAGSPTERSRKFVNRGFWIVLAAAYLIMFGVTAFAYFR